MSDPQATGNRLADESSPYLLQHADNPVHWHPWGAEALERARTENKPILLSIGYSACHWCHVMAHESFEDAETAALMNELFVNVKVDREERPDLDRIYQSAHQLLVRRAGGWPLTMFLTPDQVPFFGGTYFPKTARHGLPAFTDILRRVAGYLREHPSEIDAQNASLLSAISKLMDDTGSSDQPPGEPALERARQQLAETYDRSNGGFGGAPKFPHATHIERLVRHWASKKYQGESDDEALSMAAVTLLRMCEGGLYDHLGGGFYRYSVDAEWMIPHFEKMLYDNGPLMGLCAEMYACTGDFRFQRAAEETGNWALREMQSSDGGFYSTLDADSEGKEGKFYVWQRDRVKEILPGRPFLAFAMRYGLNREPNFEGLWHLHGSVDEPKLARKLKMPLDDLALMLDESKTRLFEARSHRVGPGRDEKILTSWNALMIQGLSKTACHLGRQDFADAAIRALDFIRAELWQNGRLLAVHKDGRSRFPAYLDDYAFLLDAVVDSLQTRWRTDHLRFAAALAHAMIDHFADPEVGGFFFTADDHEALIHRPKPLFDEAVPCGNGVAARALLRLGHLFGEQRFLDAAEQTVRWAWPAVENSPLHSLSLLLALEEWLKPGDCIVLRGSGAELARWQRRCTRPYARQRDCFAIPDTERDLPGRLASHRPSSGPVAYLRAGTKCLEPITDFAEYEAALTASEPAPAPGA